MDNRTDIKNWRAVEENNLFYSEYNMGIEGFPMWRRAPVEGFSTEEGALDYNSKMCIQTKIRIRESQ